MKSLNRYTSHLPRLAVLVGISLFSLAFQNCGAGFSSSLTKSSLLSGANVFSSTSEGGISPPDAKRQLLYGNGCTGPLPRDSNSHTDAGWINANSDARWINSDTYSHAERPESNSYTDNRYYAHSDSTSRSSYDDNGFTGRILLLVFYS